MTASTDSSSSVSQRRKRHHYVPVSYLSEWADEKGQVSVRRRDKPKVLPSSTINVAVESDLYAFPTDTGMDDALEVALSGIEKSLPQYLADIRNKRAPRKGSLERSELSYLIALQLVRTPEHRDSIMFPVDVAEFTQENPITTNGMRRFLTERYGVEQPTEGEIQGALDFANYQLVTIGLPTKKKAFSTLFRIARENLSPHLEQMAWAVEMINPDTGRFFFTSDRPVVTWKRPARRTEGIGIGIGTADEVRFPIGPNHLLVLRPKFPENRSFVSELRITHINRHLAGGCYTMVIGKRCDTSSLEQLPLRKTRPAARFNSGPLYESNGNGDLVDTGKTILHMYTPEADDL